MKKPIPTDPGEDKKTEFSHVLRETQRLSAKLESLGDEMHVIDCKLDEVLRWFRRKYIQPVQSRRVNNEKLEVLRDKVDELLKRTAPNETKHPSNSTPSIYDRPIRQLGTPPVRHHPTLGSL